MGFACFPTISRAVSVCLIEFRSETQQLTTLNPTYLLVVLGAFGHGLIRDILFGSKMEKIQGSITNNLLIVGPKYSAVA